MREYPVLAPVSRSYPRVRGRLPTCYSPVRRSSTPERAFPLDLHVLSTPPAFVLSQDQTLQQKPLKKIPATTKLSPKESNQHQKRRQPGFKKYFGTGITSTLLSSQRTTTHQPQPEPTSRRRGNSLTLPARTTLVKSLSGTFFGRSPARHARTISSMFLRGDPADRPAAPLLRRSTRPAPAGFVTLADPLRNLKSVWTSITRHSRLRSCASKRIPQVRPFSVRVPRGQRESYASSGFNVKSAPVVPRSGCSAPAARPFAVDVSAVEWRHEPGVSEQHRRWPRGPVRRGDGKRGRTAGDAGPGVADRKSVVK